MGEQHLLPGQNEPVPTGQDLLQLVTCLLALTAAWTFQFSLHLVFAMMNHFV